jgi:hypothetical protein
LKRMAGTLLLIMTLVGCGYREAPKSLTFQGKTYKLGGAGRYEFVDRNLYFLPGENNTNRTFSLDLSRVFDKKRTETEVHNILKAGLRRAVKKVHHDREDGTNYCVVYEQTPNVFYVSYHVTGEYKNGLWSTDYSHVLEGSATASACDDAAVIWKDLRELGEKTR